MSCAAPLGNHSHSLAPKRRNRLWYSSTLGTLTSAPDKYKMGQTEVAGPPVQSAPGYTLAPICKNMSNSDDLSVNQLYLIQRIRQGSSAACSELYDQHYDPIYRYCYYQVGNVTVAQGLTSEVFMRMVKNLDTFDEGRQPLQAWLYSITRDLIADLHRNSQQDQPSQKGTAPTRGFFVGYLIAETLVAALAHLTEEQRQVILLQFVQDHSTAEVTYILGKPEQAIQWQSRRALAALRHDGEVASMNQDFDAALGECLDLMRQGNETEACLAHYPQFAAELRPLLQLANKIRDVITPMPTSQARIAGRLRMLEALTEKHSQRPMVAPISPPRPIPTITQPTRKRPQYVRPVWRLAFAIAAVTILATGGTLVASATSLPGDVLYPVKLVTQQAQIALAFDAGTRSQREERFNVQRRQDIQIAAQLGRQATVELGGVLEQMGDNTWVVDGLTITLKPETMMAGQPRVGDWVMVQGNLPGNGSLVATNLTVGDRHGPQPTATSSPTPESSKTPEPTDTREPTRTPKPTYGPEPTSTPAPTQMSTPTQPESTRESKPTPTPTKETRPTPKATKEPKPTSEPKPTKEPKPTRKP